MIFELLFLGFMCWLWYKLTVKRKDWFKELKQSRTNSRIKKLEDRKYR